MKPILMIQMEDGDESNLRFILETCNQASAFMGSGIKNVERLLSGSPLSIGHLNEALGSIRSARERLAKREPDELFPKELRDRYDYNLGASENILERWAEQFVVMVTS